MMVFSSNHLMFFHVIYCIHILQKHDLIVSMFHFKDTFLLSFQNHVIKYKHQIIY